jgi:hypothetical protein
VAKISSADPESFSVQDREASHLLYLDASPSGLIPSYLDLPQRGEIQRHS